MVQDGPCPSHEDLLPPPGPWKATELGRAHLRPGQITPRFRAWGSWIRVSLDHHPSPSVTWVASSRKVGVGLHSQGSAESPWPDGLGSQPLPGLRLVGLVGSPSDKWHPGLKSRVPRQCWCCCPRPRHAVAGPDSHQGKQGHPGDLMMLAPTTETCTP